jgi:hypothetical protein
MKKIGTDLLDDLLDSKGAEERTKSSDNCDREEKESMEAIPCPFECRILCSWEAILHFSSPLSGALKNNQYCDDVDTSQHEAISIHCENSLGHLFRNAEFKAKAHSLHSSLPNPHG